MVCIHAHSRDTGFIQYFDEYNYLHFVRISHAEVTASRFPATVFERPKRWLSIQTSERRGAGPKHGSVRKRASEEGKQAYQIQSYLIFWHFQLTLSVLNCDTLLSMG